MEEYITRAAADKLLEEGLAIEGRLKINPKSRANAFVVCSNNLVINRDVFLEVGCKLIFLNLFIFTGDK